MRTLAIDTCIALAALLVFCVGYILWDKEANYYAYYAVDVSTLGPGPQNDLIRYGHALVVNTPRYIGSGAQDPAMAYAGNDLACQNCHLKAGLQPFAAPFISTAATFPMLVDNKVLTLSERINSCVELGLNGRPLPDDSREMAALIAYIEFLGKDTSEGVRLPGSGLMPIKLPVEPPDSRRGVAVFIRANMPMGTDYRTPVLTVQEAWDVAAYMISKPHPIAPPKPEAERELDLEVDSKMQQGEAVSP